jgi:hypothetical protein
MPPDNPPRQAADSHDVIQVRGARGAASVGEERHQGQPPYPSQTIGAGGTVTNRCRRAR